VTLDVIVAAFEQGSTPEEIRQDFPTLRLADIYAVLTYYLQHRERIEVYLHKRQGEATELRPGNRDSLLPSPERSELIQ